MRWYYIPRSSFFDYYKYDIDAITRILDKRKIPHIRLEPQYGWTNQPEVVCFRTGQKQNCFLQQDLEKHFGTEWIHIEQKTWRCLKKLSTDYDTGKSPKALYDLRRKGGKKSKATH